MSDIKLTDEMLQVCYHSMEFHFGHNEAAQFVAALRALRDVATALLHSRRPLVNSDDVYGFRQSVEVEWLDALDDLLPEVPRG